MIDLWEHLKQSKKDILLYGMGNGADKIIDFAEKKGIKISGVFASDNFVRKKCFRGFDMIDYTTVKAKYKDPLILLSFGTKLNDVIENIKKMAVEYEFYAPDVPVYGSTLFDLNFAKNHKDELEFVYSRLEDDTSKKCFENIVLYKLSGKTEYLYSCESSRRDYFKILKSEEIENYLDLGAYNGDTVSELMTYAALKKVIAVEPDSHSFKKLLKNTNGFNFIKNINACISDREGTVFLKSGKGRGTSVSEQGTMTNCLTIDGIIKNEKIDYIKFDVEGEEIKAINGGLQTIKSQKPKLCIAAYHRSEDLFAIPKKILSINSSYKIYMRHTHCLPAWDTDFIFV